MSPMASSGGTIPTGGASQASAAPADLACTERQQPQLASISGKQGYSCVVSGTTMLPCSSSCETVRSTSWKRCTLCELERKRARTRRRSARRREGVAWRGGLWRG